MQRWAEQIDERRPGGAAHTSGYPFWMKSKRNRTESGQAKPSGSEGYCGPTDCRNATTDCRIESGFGPAGKTILTALKPLTVAFNLCKF